MNGRLVKIVIKAILALIWLASFAIAVIWIKHLPFRYDPEPLTYFFGLATVALTSLYAYFANALETEQYSVANVLAKGYVNNYLEPVMTQLIKSASGKGVKPLLYIFIPNLLSDLTPKNIDRLKVKLKERGHLENTVKIKLSEGRGVRDVMTVSNSKAQNVFIDFPNTLYALTDFVEFKMDSPKDSLKIDLKNKIGKEYIERFKAQLIDSLREKHLYPEYIKFTDSDLKIEF